MGVTRTTWLHGPCAMMVVEWPVGGDLMHRWNQDQSTLKLDPKGEDGNGNSSGAENDANAHVSNKSSLGVQHGVWCARS